MLRVERNVGQCSLWLLNFGQFQIKLFRHCFYCNLSRPHFETSPELYETWTFSFVQYMQMTHSVIHSYHSNITYNNYSDKNKIIILLILLISQNKQKIKEHVTYTYILYDGHLFLVLNS